jgi:hypothetical protein
MQPTLQTFFTANVQTQSTNNTDNQMDIIPSPQQSERYVGELVEALWDENDDEKGEVNDLLHHNNKS